MAVFEMTLREQFLQRFALKHGVLSAILVHAVNGILLIGSVLASYTLYTAPLILALSLLFGPLLGFSFPSLFIRFEDWFGKKSGGQALRDDLYRFIAWAFLPAAVFAFSSEIIRLTFLSSYGWMYPIKLALCAAVTLFCVRSYLLCASAAQGFRLRKGVWLSLTSCVATVITLAIIASLIVYLFETFTELHWLMTDF